MVGFSTPPSSLLPRLFIRTLFTLHILASKVTFMLRLSVDENPLKLQLLLELLEVRQLHIRAGGAEKSNSMDK